MKLITNLLNGWRLLNQEVELTQKNFLKKISSDCREEETKNLMCLPDGWIGLKKEKYQK